MKLFGLKLYILMFLLCGGFLFSDDFTDYPYQSKYDPMFVNLTDPGIFSNYLVSDDPDMVISALKRVGQLKIMNVKSLVESLIAEANPAANLGKPDQRAGYNHMFNLCALVLGVIGDDSDAGIMSSYLPDVSGRDNKVYLLKGIGELSQSQAALRTLNLYTQKINMKTDSSIVNQLVDSILMHNSKSSIVPLIDMRRNAPMVSRDKIDYAISQLDKKGIAETNGD